MLETKDVTFFENLYRLDSSATFDETNNETIDQENSNNVEETEIRNKNVQDERLPWIAPRGQKPVQTETDPEGDESEDEFHDIVGSEVNENEIPSINRKI